MHAVVLEGLTIEHPGELVLDLKVWKVLHCVCLQHLDTDAKTTRKKEARDGLNVH